MSGEGIVSHNGPGGWRFDLERPELIYQRSRETYRYWRAAFDAWAAEYPWDVPTQIDRRPWFDVQNQGNIGSCFPPGQMVRMKGFSTKKIEDVKVGDQVCTKHGLIRPVIQTMARKYDGELMVLSTVPENAKAKSQVVMCTLDHPVWVAHNGDVSGTTGQYIEAEKLRPGDPVLVFIQPAGTTVWQARVRPLQTVSYVTHVGVVHDIEVEDEHSFLCGDIAVHNCQGNALADAVELAYMLKYGPEIQLSRFWAYAESQRIDGISGDSGSTLEAGGQAARTVGICTEAKFPYPASYSAGKSFWQANRAALLPEAKDFRLDGEVPLASWKDAVDFLKSNIGGIQTGLMWGSSMDRFEVTSYTPGSGGHSTLIDGFEPMPSWPDGIGLWNKNSWGLNWPPNKGGGYQLISRAAFEQMLAGRWNQFIGRTQANSPTPQPNPDF